MQFNIENIVFRTRCVNTYNSQETCVDIYETGGDLLGPYAVVELSGEDRNIIQSIKIVEPDDIGQLIVDMIPEIDDYNAKTIAAKKEFIARIFGGRHGNS